MKRKKRGLHKAFMERAFLCTARRRNRKLAGGRRFQGDDNPRRGQEESVYVLQRKKYHMKIREKG